MKLMRSCFTVSRKSQAGTEPKNMQNESETCLQWSSKEIQEWLVSANLRHLKPKFMGLSGKDLLQMSPIQCCKITNNDQEASQLVQRLFILKAEYVDYLVSQGIPLPLITPLPEHSTPTPENSPNNSHASAPLLSLEHNKGFEEKRVQQNPVLGVSDPVRKMLIVSRILSEKFAIRGKFFTIEQAYSLTGIPVKLIHDVMNTLVSVKVVAPFNDGYIWVGTQRLQVRDVKQHQDDDDNSESEVIQKIVNVNLGSLTPWIVQMLQKTQSENEKMGEVSLSQYTIVQEILREHIDEHTQNKDLMSETVRDACTILAAIGVIEQKKNIGGYVYRWILPYDENIDPTQTSTHSSLKSEVMNSAKLFDVPGQVLKPTNSNLSSRQGTPVNSNPNSRQGTPRSNSPAPFSERSENSQNIRVGAIETGDPGSVSSLKRMFQSSQNQQSS